MIYEIIQRLADIVDAIEEFIAENTDETTGVIDDSALEELIAKQEEKVATEFELEEAKENLVLYYKNLVAEGKAIREEEKALAERRKRVDHKSETLFNFIGRICKGEKFKTSKCEVSYRKSTSTEIVDESQFYAFANDGNDDLLTFKEPTPNKAAIKKALQDGRTIPGAALVDKVNMSIK